MIRMTTEEKEDGDDDDDDDDDEEEAEQEEQEEHELRRGRGRQIEGQKIKKDGQKRVRRNGKLSRRTLDRMRLRGKLKNVPTPPPVSYHPKSGLK